MYRAPCGVNIGKQQTWINPNTSVLQRHAICLNYAELAKLQGTEYNIEEQRANYLAQNRLQKKHFLRQHQHINNPVLHYQNLPQYDHRLRKKTFSYGDSNEGDTARGPRTTPIPYMDHAFSDGNNSLYEHISSNCNELDGAIRTLTNVALEHVKDDKSRVLMLGKPKALKAELHERNRKYVHHPIMQSLTKVTLNGTPSVTLSLPLQRAKTLPENILKLVQSTSDIPQTRFRYQKSSQQNQLAESRPSGYQIAYHKAKEKFKEKHIDHNLNVNKKSQKKSNSSATCSYGNFGSSSDFGRIHFQSDKAGLRGTVGSKNRKYDSLPNISKMSHSKVDQHKVRDNWHRIYDQWSRTGPHSPKREISRSNTSSSLPSVRDKA